MGRAADSLNLGLSDYAISAYTTLLTHHPANGSQLSRLSGIPRPRIYDVLRMLKKRGFVTESAQGIYIPLPPDELIQRLRSGWEENLKKLERLIQEAQSRSSYEAIWTIRGYAAVMAKSEEMIRRAKSEIYARLFPEEGERLAPVLLEAGKRGVEVKYIAMKEQPHIFELQVVHPNSDAVETELKGRSFDIVVDKEEILGGLFVAGQEDQSLINWGRNRWFVLAGRDSLRHDFFHYFLHKTYQLKQQLTESEQALYERIRKDT
jgi:HTH-type transcriptional regulator, sugar sensing transcriptional regulator